jgi:type II secretory pathway pseudopilin PulG
MLFKKGAMFGLDARIALAIFGALSVISGAALYSAIKEAKLTKVVTELKEVEKALEQYLLDTGVDLPVHSINPVTRDIEQLIKDTGTTGWKGPYLQGEVESGNNSRFIMAGSDAMYFKIKSATDVAWEAPEDDSGTGDGTCGSPCYYWIEMRSDGAFTTEDLKSIEEKFDSTSDFDEGNARVYVDFDVFYLKAFKILND